MDVALITPYDRLADTVGRPYHMLLPSCLHNREYVETYGSMTRVNGKPYFILDNGMFEGSMVSNERLIEQAEALWIDELIMPDVRGSMWETISKVVDFLRVFECAKFTRAPKLGIVIQIKEYEEVPRFLHSVQNLEDQFLGVNEMFTICIPRKLAEGPLGPRARIEIVSWIRDMNMNNPIHLLGFSREGGVYETRSLSDKVRSMDTGLPYVCAAKDVKINMVGGDFPEAPNFMDVTDYDDEFVKHNIFNIDRWACGKL